MLSNRTTNLHPGQHRRQNSTPDLLDTPKVHNHSATTSTVSHRRGLSLDQQTNTQLSKFKFPQDEEKDTLTQEYENYQQHLLLQEVQQQHKQARPGPQSPTQNVSKGGALKPLPLKPYPEYGSQDFTHDRYTSHATDLSNGIGRSPMSDNKENENNKIHADDTTNFAGHFESFEFGIGVRTFNNELGGELSTYETISNGVTIGSGDQDGPERPSTPQNHSESIYFPITPNATPFADSKKRHCAAKGQSAGSSPVINDPNMTIKPLHTMARTLSCQDIFNTSTDTSGSKNLLSPPNSGKLIPASSFDVPELPPPDFQIPPSINLDFLSDEPIYEPSQVSPTSNTFSTAISSFQSSPEIEHLSSLGGKNESSSQLLALDPPSSLSSAEHLIDNRGYSPRAKKGARSRPGSISDFDLDPILEDTGITSEEIAVFIRGPNPIDGKWTCTFQDCNRSFGRKENIKSHVQTHLGDRQYRCTHCGNTFVRQHDLKRHAKIHSGIKPYPCLCGRSFARHDALTRHRQRNTCIGGFEGISKKPTKRGRPKKARPDADQRLQKATRTRQRVFEKAYPSSASGSSQCSFSSPPEIFDDIEISGGRLFDPDEPAKHNVAEFPSFTPPSSPGHPHDNYLSMHVSQKSQEPNAVSTSPPPGILRIPDGIEELSSGQEMSRETSSTYYSTSPELDMLSSPTFADFDLDPSVDTFAIDIMDQIILKLGNDDTFSSAEKDPMQMMGGANDPIFGGSLWSDNLEERAKTFFDDLC